MIVNPSAPVGEGDVKPTPTGQMIVDFMKGRMPAYIETGMNLIDVDDVAPDISWPWRRAGIGERYILGNKNLMLREVFEILSRLTGVKAPTHQAAASGDLAAWLISTNGWPGSPAPRRAFLWKASEWPSTRCTTIAAKPSGNSASRRHRWKWRLKKLCDGSNPMVMANREYASPNSE